MVDPIRINYDSETGISDMGVAVNVMIDETGFTGRRPGYTGLVSGACHSLFCCGYNCLFIKDGVMYRLNPDYSSTEIAILDGNDTMAYVQVNQDIYYTNGKNKGIVPKDSDAINWDAQTYVGPDTNKSFDGPRFGSHLAFFSGRIFVSEENVVWWSQPFAFGLFDRTRDFAQFESKVLMVRPVENGIFVSDEKRTYFINGKDPKDFSLEIVAEYPAIEWSEAKETIKSTDIGLENLAIGECAVWMSKKGVCIGLPDGKMINVTRNKIVYPQMNGIGAGVIRGYNFIHTVGE